MKERNANVDCTEIWDKGPTRAHAFGIPGDFVGAKDIVKERVNIYLFDERSFVPGAREVKTSPWFSVERIL